MGPLQETDYFCAPASIKNALRFLGQRSPSQINIAKLCGTTQDGTDESGILQCLGILGVKVSILETRCSSIARAWLLHNAEHHALILCVDSWDHWITTIGVTGGRIRVQDPERLLPDILTTSRILSRWKAPSHYDGAIFYGVKLTA